MKRLALVVATAALAAGCAQTPYAPAPAAQYQAPQPEPAVHVAQDRLRALGYYNGPVDGLRGPATDAAIERFQRDHGLAASGQLDDATRNAMRADLGRSTPQAAIPLGDTAAVQRLQARLQQLGLYHGAVDGTWGPDTRTALESFQRVRGLDVTGEPTEATLAALGMPPGAGAVAVGTVAQPLDPSVVRTIQERLRADGYYSGRIDGVWGPRAQQAVTNFQRGRGLQPTGDLNPMTLSALGLDPNNLAGGYGSSMPPR